MTAVLIEVAGWIGAICVLGAYALLSAGKLNSQSAFFHILNMVGAAGFVINTWAHGAIPSMVLNVVWACVGGYALFRIVRKGQG